MQELSRSGQVPWRLPALRALLDYIPSSDFFLVPVGHTLLRDVLRPLQIFVLSKKLSKLPQGNRIIFNKEARRMARVCMPALSSCATHACGAAVRSQPLPLAAANAHSGGRGARGAGCARSDGSAGGAA